MENILLHHFQTPFESAPFEQIDENTYGVVMMQLMDQARAEINAIVDNAAQPTFENTIETLEKAGRQLNVVSTIFFNLHSAETNDVLEKIAEEVSPLLSDFSNDIMLNAALFAKVKSVFENTDLATLSEEQSRLLSKTYKGFTKNGALLNEDDKQTLRQIDQELSMLTIKFSQNVLAETNAYTLHLTDEADLVGLPDSIKAMAEAEAKARNLEGWMFTLQYPSLTPFLKYSAHRELRKQMHLAAGQKAFKANEFNNEAHIKRIVALRSQRAQVLGYKHHADFVLEERMAKSPDEVNSFLQDLLAKATPAAHKEMDGLKAFAAQDGIETLMPYDHAFYAEKWREAQYDFSEEVLKPYFELDKVLKAAFDVSEKLYGLTFVLRNDIEKYNPEIEVYEVLENGVYKALLYTDFFPRKGKRPGAWMTSFKGQYIDDQGNHRPHISIVCNFSRPVGDAPSLLTFMEVTTLFHEFGHALHGMLANTHYESLSGTNVFWDFVELPSQFMENYCYDKTFLQSFAKHYQTGEVLPEEWIDRLVASANFMQGYQTMRQLGFGILDMAYHSNQFTDQHAVEAFETQILANTQLYPKVDGVALSPSFSHIFAGGYAAGYYSYKWAEILDADAYAYFQEKGIFNPEVAQAFKILLSSGATKDPMDLYIAFRGRKPTNEALLKRAGLL